MIGRNGERRSGISALAARHDDDDDDDDDVEGRPVIVVVDINSSSNSGFVLSWASINDCFISSYFFYSKIVIGILATTSAGRDDITV